MKRIIPFLIIVSVFSIVLTTGFLILKASISSDESNVKLVKAFLIANPTSTSMVGFTHLADADSEIARPISPAVSSVASLQEIQPIAMATTTASATETTSPTQTSATGTNDALSLEVLAATMTNLQK